jgi:formate dehydrogenase subunit gamma
MTSDHERDLEVVRELLVSAPAAPDQLLPLLHAVQERLGHVSSDAIRVIADAFNLSRAEVYGVVSFYGDFRETPAGRHLVQVCMAEACQAVGCRALAAHAERALGATLGSATSDGQVQIEAAYCFGNCALGPTIRIDDAVHGRVTPERFDTLVSPLLQRSARA